MRKIIVVIIVLVAVSLIYFVFTKPGDFSKEEFLICENCNVIWLVPDGVGAQYLSLYGYERPTTPFLDQIAEERGIVFENAISQSCWSPPSFASMLTAKYPAELGTYGMFQLTDSFLPPEEKTIAATLKECGYQTHAISNGPFVQPECGFDNGFDTFSSNPVLDQPDMPHILQEAASWLKEERDPKKPFFLFMRPLHPVALNLTPSDEALAEFEEYEEWGRVKKDAGFEIYKDLNIVFNKKGRVEEIRGVEPGTDIYLEFKDKAEKRLYAYNGLVREFDMALEGFWKDLKEMDLLENTIIIINGDHGVEFGQHGINHAYFQVYNETVNPLLVLFIPGIKARRLSPVAELRAVAPTILDFLGLQEEPAFAKSLSPAKSLRGHITGEVKSAIGRSSAAFDEQSLGQIYGLPDADGVLRAARVGAPKGVVIKPREEEYLGPVVSTVRSERWSIIVNSDKSVELYDLFEDPGQYNNLFPTWTDLPSEDRREALEVIRELGVDVPVPAGLYAPRKEE